MSRRKSRELRFAVEPLSISRARRVIWAGFGALVFAAVMGLVVIHMPPDPRMPLKRAENKDYYDRDTNFTPFSLRVDEKG